MKRVFCLLLTLLLFPAAQSVAEIDVQALWDGYVYSHTLDGRGLVVPVVGFLDLCPDFDEVCAGSG